MDIGSQNLNHNESKYDNASSHRARIDSMKSEVPFYILEQQERDRENQQYKR